MTVDSLHEKGPASAGPFHATRASTQTARQIRQRVARYAVEARLEMQVVTGGRAGGADPADDLARADVLADVHQDRRLVAVTGGEARAAEDAVADAGVV